MLSVAVPYLLDFSPVKQRCVLPDGLPRAKEVDIRAPDHTEHHGDR